MPIGDEGWASFQKGEAASAKGSHFVARSAFKRAAAIAKSNGDGVLWSCFFLFAVLVAQTICCFL